MPGEDATVVANLKRAGAVLLGKLNMSEFAMGDAFHHPYGRPHNPWDLSRNAGTSSSGSGAATAAFLCATSLGEDTGGSIRGPAAFCGLTGIRPSWGRVSRYGVLGAAWSMDIAGPISRTVADCAIMLAAIAGYDPKDPYTWDVPVPDYLAAMTGDIRDFKVGVIQERVNTNAVDPDIRDGVVKAISVLGELGAHLEDVSIPLIADSAAISAAVTAVDAVNVHQNGIRDHLDQYDHNIQIRLLTGSIMPAQAHQKAVRLREMLRRQINRGVGESGCLGNAHVVDSGIAAAHAGGNKQQRRGSRGLCRTARLHGSLQPGQPSRPFRRLRIHAGKSAHRPSDRGQTLRRINGFPGGPRLPASHRMAHAASAYLSSKRSALSRRRSALIII